MICRLFFAFDDRNPTLVIPDSLTQTGLLSGQTSNIQEYHQDVGVLLSDLLITFGTCTSYSDPLTVCVL